MNLAIDFSAWGWPQWAYVALLGLRLILNAALDGKPKTEQYSAGVAIVGVAITIFLLSAGGFFS